MGTKTTEEQREEEMRKLRKVSMGEKSGWSLEK